MFGLTVAIFLVIILSIYTSISLYKKETAEAIIGILLLFVFIYVTLNTIKSVF